MSNRLHSAWWQSAAIVVVAAVSFLLSVGGYLALFPRIESSHPSVFQSRVADALAAQDIERAMTIARRAVDVYRPSQSARFGASPLPHTVLAAVLFQAGQDNEALRHLNLAIDVTRTPYPPPEETRKPFYFAPARLELGAYWLRREQLPLAIQNFELARAYADPAAEDFKRFEDPLFHAYARQGYWSRALECREPTDAEFDRLAPADFEIIARVCEKNHAWSLARRVGQYLEDRSESAALAHYLLGRSSLAEGPLAEAARHLEVAVNAGHPYAGYFLGVVLEGLEQPREAIRAHLSVAESSLYRIFALARADAVQSKLPSDSPAAGTTIRQDLLNQFMQRTASMRPIDKASILDPYVRLTPTAYEVPEGALSVCAPFPILILWEDARAEPGNTASDPGLSVDDDNGVLSLRSGTRVLQLQWVENLVNWALIDRLPEGPGPVPCWIDTAMDWFKLRSGTVASVNREGGDSCLEINGLTWLYSAPIPVQYDAGYLMFGRVRGQPRGGGINFQAVAPTELVISEWPLPGEIAPERWTWQTGYAESLYIWDRVRLHLGVTSNSLPVEFDDITLIAVAKPGVTN